MFARPLSRFLLFTLFLLALSLPLGAASAGNNDIQWNELGHNSRDPLYRSPQGAVPLNTPVRLRLRAADGDLTAAQVRYWNDRLDQQSLLNMTKVASGVQFPGDAASYEFWEVTLPPSALPTVYWYRFIAIDGTDTNFYEDDGARNGGWGQVYDNSPDASWQLTHYDPNFQTPDWVQNAVIYQIFADRFRDGNPANNVPAGTFHYGANNSIVRSNTADWNTFLCDPRSRPGSSAVCANAYSQNFYGGDLQGIIDQLPYLDSLGITALYLNPIFEAPSNHKYDTTDFFQIDDNFGDLATFQALASQAEALGIRLILDGVFNHTSSDSIYFDRYGRYSDVGACESTSSPRINWFPFKAYTGPGSAPCSNNRDYNYWFGIFDSLPVMNHDDPGVRDYFINQGTSSVGPYWMQWADGWRLDVAPEIDHGTINDPTDNYWEAFRAAVHAVNPETYIVGEEWGNPTSWTIDNQWDATMNYQFSSAVLSLFRDETFVDNDHNGGSSAGVLSPLSPGDFNERILNLRERYAPEAFAAMMNLLGSHDTSRALFMLDHNTETNDTALYNNPAYDWSDAISRLRGVALVQLTMPGAPTIYYGDEVGAVNPPAYDGSQWQDDPYNRVPFPWLDQSGTPYYAHMQSQAEQDALKNWYTQLIAIRNANPALRTGSYDPLLTNDPDVLVYGRQMPDDSSTAIVFVNRSNAPQSVSADLSGYIPSGINLTDALTGAVVPYNGGTLTQTVPARGGVILIAPAFSGRPGIVTDLVATGGANAITLDWSDIPSASYDIYRSRLSGGGYEFIGNASGSSAIDSDVTNGVRYYYVVVAVDGLNGLRGEFSNEASAIPAYDLSQNAWFNLQWPYTLNHILSATNPTDWVFGQIWIGGVTDTSSDPVPSIRAQVGYGPQADAPSSPSWTWFEMETNPDYEFSNNNDEYRGKLLPTQAGTFYYTTRWSADNGNTWFYTDREAPPYDASRAGVLTVTESSDTTPPAAPTSLVVTGTTSVSVSLGWTPPSDSDLYAFEIWRENTASPGFSKVATVTDAAATSFTDSTVTAGQTYNYYVVAVDTSLNASAPSNTVTATAEMRMVAVTINVDVPANTPASETVFMAGSFQNPQWQPGDTPMTRVDADTWTITLNLLDGTRIEYKHTRGSWDKVEKGADGNFEINNRTLTAAYGTTGTMTVNYAIENWRDPYVVSFTPPNGAVLNTSGVVISATWNQSMNESSVEAPAGFSVTGPGGAVEGSIVYDDASKTATFTPNAPLANGQYNVSIAGRNDVNGDSQQLPAAWSFSVNAAPPGPAVTGFTLVNADTEADIAPLTGGTVDVSATRRISVRADVGGGTVGSVVFTVNGQPFRTENVAPYSLGADTNGNYAPWPYVLGQSYTLMATPYSGTNGTGTPGTPASITFTLVNPTLPAVTGFTLVDADTNQPLTALTNNAIIDLAAYPGTQRVNIVAVVSGTPGSVRFNVNGRNVQTENVAPFALAGDTNGDYNVWTFALNQNYTLTATPFTEARARGDAGAPLTVAFTITNASAPNVPTINPASMGEGGVTAAPTLGEAAPVPAEGAVPVNEPPKEDAGS